MATWRLNVNNVGNTHYWSTLGPGNITGTNVGSYTAHLGSAAHRGRVDGGGLLSGGVVAWTRAHRHRWLPGRHAGLTAEGVDQLHVCHAGSLLAAFTQVEGDVREGTTPRSPSPTRRAGAWTWSGAWPRDASSATCIAPADHLVIDAMLKPARARGLFDRLRQRTHGAGLSRPTDSEGRRRSRCRARSRRSSSVPQRRRGAWHDVLTAPGVRISRRPSVSSIRAATART